MLKLLKFPKFGNCSVNNDKLLVGTISCDVYKKHFWKLYWCTTLQKLKNYLDLISEHDDWDKDLIDNNYKSPDRVEIVIYYASQYLCRCLLKFTKCKTCLNSFLTNLDTFNLAVAEFWNTYEKKDYLPGYLLNSELYLYDIFLNTDNFFVKKKLYYIQNVIKKTQTLL